MDITLKFRVVEGAITLQNDIIRMLQDIRLVVERIEGVESFFAVQEREKDN